MRAFATAFVAGTFVLQQAASLPPPRVGLLGIACLLAVALVPHGSRVLRVALLLAAGALAGYGYAAARAEARLEESLPLAMEGRDIEIQGVVAGLPQEGDKGVRFLFAVEEGDAPSLVSLAWYAERGAKDGGAVPPRIEAGQRWRLTVRLKRPRGLANPHAFDLEPWALERGIRAVGYVRTQPAPALAATRVFGWPQTLHRWRGEIRESMMERLAGERLRGVLVALAIGDQDAIAARDWEVFWRTGIGHLVSISGLHITMLAGLAFALVFFLWVRVPALALRLPARKAAAVAGVAVALAYALMTGYAVPAQRTVVMLAFVAACVLADRHGSPSRVLPAAAWVVAMVDPWAALSPGFWLSFGAVAGIFYAVSLRVGSRGRLRAMLVEQLAVTVAMLPMLVALFQEVSLVSPLANAFAIPVVSLVVAPLAIAGAFLPVPGILELAHAILAALMVPLEWLASLPGAMLESHAPRPWTVAAAAAGSLWILAPRGVPMRSCGAVWMAPLFVVVPAGPAWGEAWIDVLDVGNGLAIVVRTASRALAYDAGPSWSPDADSGSRIVVPYLRGEGVSRLDGLVVSHADDDHAGGAASLARSRAPPWLLSPLAADHPLHAQLARTIRCESGLHWRWDGVDFDVLHPAAAAYGEARRKENDRCCVLRVSTAGASALLAGDAEARSEREMLARAPAGLRSDVLVIPHHGSKTSSTAEFIAAVDPGVGVLSVGHLNRFRHPNDAVVARYVERGVALRRTDREGALRAVLPREGAVPPPAALQPGCRYWSERPC
jgi:competence protein ComEC